MLEKKSLLLKLCFKFPTQLKMTAESAKVLDMALNAVDDQYDGCRTEAMEKFIHLDLLGQEQNNTAFQKAWSADAKCSKLIPGGIKEHTSALMAYFNGDAGFIKLLNNEVETQGVNVSIYETRFKFKSFHFLLMDSMKLLNPHPKKCQTVFFAPDKKYTATKGSEVRFGRFIKASSSYETLLMEDLDEVIIFNITSCFFVNLGDDVCADEKDAVLLSPAEVFTVEEIGKKDVGDESVYTQIVLKHLKVDSFHNCYIFSR